MDYEKEYNEALERAKDCYVNKRFSELEDTPKEICEHIFPELRESEDERMRKEIISIVKAYRENCIDEGTHRFDDCLSWLEKQNHDGKKWITPAELNRLETLRYEAGFDAGVRSEKEKQKEQKPDIELIQRSWYMEGYHDREFGKEPKWILKTGEGGPKHELNPRYGESLSTEQPKQEWSEEDEDYYDAIIVKLEVTQDDAMLTDEQMSFLKSIPERFNLQPKQEWSEEDECHLASIIGCIELCNKDTKDAASVLGYYDSDIDWLKSLRPSWRPSEEQMEALLWCTAHLGGADHRVLAELYEHLKMYCL